MTTSSSSQKALLVERTFNLTINKLISYGNEISVDHHLALWGLAETMAAMLFGDCRRRLRLGLPCGMGKSTAVKAFVQAVYELGLPHRIVVAASKVEESCGMKRELVGREGIPAESVGLIHSYPYAPRQVAKGLAKFASEPSENHGAQFLFVTHANVHSGGKVRPWMEECDLLIYDESLIVGDSFCIPLSRDLDLDSVQAELGRLSAFVGKGNPQLDSAHQVVKEVFDLAWEASRARVHEEVALIGSTELTVDGLPEATEFLKTFGRRLANIVALLEWIQVGAEIRLFGNREGHMTLVAYAISVPDVIDRILVLDASDPIRKLVHFDDRMARAEDVVPALHRFRDRPGGMASIKRHDNVKVFHACEGGGRSTMTKHFRGNGPNRVQEKLIKLVARKSTESTLVFIYKTGDGAEVDFIGKLRQGLLGAGIDPDEEVACTPDGRPLPRVAFATWGTETGTNEFADFQNVVLLGVMLLPEEAIASRFLGQVDDLRDPRMNALYRELQLSEASHLILQAMNRIRIRRVTVVDGQSQAMPCEVYIWHNDPGLESRMAPVLPGAPEWSAWREEGEDLTAVDVYRLMRAHLRELEASGVFAVSAKKLKEQVAASVPGHVFQQARKILCDSGLGWYQDQRTLRKDPPVTDRVDREALVAA